MLISSITKTPLVVFLFSNLIVSCVLSVQPIEYVAGPWKDYTTQQYVTEFMCSYNLDRRYASDEWTLTITTTTPTVSLLIWKMEEVDKIGNTYYLQNIDYNGPGVIDLLFQLNHRSEDPIVGECHGYATESSNFQLTSDRESTPVESFSNREVIDSSTNREVIDSSTNREVIDSSTNRDVIDSSSFIVVTEWHSSQAVTDSSITQTKKQSFSTHDDYYDYDNDDYDDNDNTISSTYSDVKNVSSDVVTQSLRSNSMSYSPSTKAFNESSSSKAFLGMASTENAKEASYTSAISDFPSINTVTEMQTTTFVDESFIFDNINTSPQTSSGTDLSSTNAQSYSFSTNVGTDSSTIPTVGDESSTGFSFTTGDKFVNENYPLSDTYSNVYTSTPTNQEASTTEINISTGTDQSNSGESSNSLLYTMLSTKDISLSKRHTTTFKTSTENDATNTIYFSYDQNKDVVISTLIPDSNRNVPMTTDENTPAYDMDITSQKLSLITIDNTQSQTNTAMTVSDMAASKSEKITTESLTIGQQNIITNIHNLVTTDQTPLKQYSTSCVEVCRCISGVNLTTDEIDRKVDSLVKELKIDKKGTTSAKNKKISASDDRPSSKAFGLIGILVLCSFTGLIVLADFENFVQLIKKRIKRGINVLKIKYNTK